MNNFINQNIKNQFPFILYQLKNLEQSFIKKRHIHQKWSIQEHLAHLGRYQEIFLARLSLILEKDAPNLTQYKADNDPLFYDWCDLAPSQIIQKASASRMEIIHLLEQLTTNQIQRIGVHPKFSSMNVEDWTSFFLLHEAHHIYTIFRLKQQFK